MKNQPVIGERVRRTAVRWRILVDGALVAWIDAKSRALAIDAYLRISKMDAQRVEAVTP